MKRVVQAIKFHYPINVYERDRVELEFISDEFVQVTVRDMETNGRVVRLMRYEALRAKDSVGMPPPAGKPPGSGHSRRVRSPAALLAGEKK